MADRHTSIKYSRHPASGLAAAALLAACIALVARSDGHSVDSWDNAPKPTPEPDPATVPANGFATMEQSTTYNRGTASMPTLYDAKFLRVNEEPTFGVDSRGERIPAYVHKVMSLPQ